MILGQFPCFFGIFHIKPFDRPTFLNYPENLQQELRSSGTGHRKGKGYQKISKVFDVQKENYAETFSNILESTTSFLNYIGAHLEELSK